MADRRTRHGKSGAGPPNLYLHLFHGRTDPEEDMDSTGENGPFIGPFQYFHWTYGTRMVLGTDDTHDAELPIEGDLIGPIDGVFYGDYEVVSELPTVGRGVEVNPLSWLRDRRGSRQSAGE
jgi:hypothetical protein